MLPSHDQLYYDVFYEMKAFGWTIEKYEELHDVEEDA